MVFACVRVLGDCRQKESSLRTKSYSRNHPTSHAPLLKCLEPRVTAALQGHKLSFHLSLCSMLGRLELIFTTKSRAKGGGGFGNNSIMLQKGKSSLELEMCWPPLHYQVPHSHLYPVVEHCQQNSQKTSVVWELRPTLGRVCEGLSPSSCLGGQLLSWTRKELRWALVQVVSFPSLALAECYLELAGRKLSQRHFKRSNLLNLVALN